MKQKKIIEATDQQVAAIVNILNEFSATIGSAENDDERIRWIKNVDRLLINNGISRGYK